MDRVFLTLPHMPWIDVSFDCVVFRVCFCCFTVCHIRTPLIKYFCCLSVCIIKLSNQKRLLFTFCWRQFVRCWNLKISLIQLEDKEPLWIFLSLLKFGTHVNACHYHNFSTSELLSYWNQLTFQQNIGLRTSVPLSTAVMKR